MRVELGLSKEEIALLEAMDMPAPIACQVCCLKIGYCGKDREEAGMTARCYGYKYVTEIPDEI